MIDPSVLRTMLANGATAEMIVAVVEAAYEADEKKKAVKKAHDAERQRKKRERERNGESRDVTHSHAESRGHDVTECDETDRTAQKESPPYPPKKNIYTPTEAKASVPPTTKAKRGTRLPDDWNPPEALWLKAQADFGVAEPMLRFETSAFRDHFVAKTGAGATKLDWGRAWMNWIRESVRRNQRRGGIGPPKNKTDAATERLFRRHGVLSE